MIVSEPFAGLWKFLEAIRDDKTKKDNFKHQEWKKFDLKVTEPSQLVVCL